MDTQRALCRTTQRKAVTATILSALLIAGCKKSGQTGKGQPGATAAYTQIDYNMAGAISGTIHFNKKAPPRIEIDMAQDPACSLSGTNMSEQYMVKDGNLQNVFIYVKDGLGNKLYPIPSAPVVLDQQGCRYVPHVIGVMVGQPVEFRNSDATMHNVHTIEGQDGQPAANPEIDISQPPKGGTTQRTFAHPQLMIPVRCNNHPWMNAFINVSPDPFYAVSDENGHYEIHGLPPGTYTLVADHEELGQQTTMVTVTSKQTASADFTYGTGAGQAQ